MKLIGGRYAMERIVLFWIMASFSAKIYP